MAGAKENDAGAIDYSCKMCRAKLFTSDDLMEHVPMQHQIAARKVCSAALNKNVAVVWKKLTFVLIEMTL